MNWNIFKFKKTENLIFSFLLFFLLYIHSELCKTMHFFSERNADFPTLNCRFENVNFHFKVWSAQCVEARFHLFPSEYLLLSVGGQDIRYCVQN